MAIRTKPTPKESRLVDTRTRFLYDFFEASLLALDFHVILTLGARINPYMFNFWQLIIVLNWHRTEILFR
jgi:hypothetical protein